MLTRIALACAPAALALTLAGCGSKGELMMPAARTPQPAAAAAAPSATPPAPAAPTPATRP